jgi:NADH:flavin oxidoreductase / NADH oxidase family
MKIQTEANATSEPVSHRPNDQTVRLIPRAGRAGTDHDREVPEIDLLSPLTIRGVSFRNRIAMSPMCEYSAQDGFANDWHLVHLGSRAVGGTALIMVEATAVTAEGRISAGDLGIWKDEHIELLARIAKFVHSQGAVAGISWRMPVGRRVATWRGKVGRASSRLSKAAGQWLARVLYHSTKLIRCPSPWMRLALMASSMRSRPVLGALLKQGSKFLRSMQLTATCCTNFSRRSATTGMTSTAVAWKIACACYCRSPSGSAGVMPEELPLFVRISATDWVEGGWEIEQSVELAKQLKGVGVDLIDVSSGGTVPHARIPVAKGYQVPFARRIREEVDNQNRRCRANYRTP